MYTHVCYRKMSHLHTQNEEERKSSKRHAKKLFENITLFYDIVI